MTETRSSGGGIGITSVLGIVFIVLKLVGVIDWPWIWVLSPWWITILVVLSIVLIGLAVAAISEWFGTKKRLKKLGMK